MIEQHSILELASWGAWIRSTGPGNNCDRCNTQAPFNLKLHANGVPYVSVLQDAIRTSVAPMSSRWAGSLASSPRTGLVVIRRHTKAIQTRTGLTEDSLPFTLLRGLEQYSADILVFCLQASQLTSHCRTCRSAAHRLRCKSVPGACPLRIRQARHGTDKYSSCSI